MTVKLPPYLVRIARENARKLKTKEKKLPKRSLAERRVVEQIAKHLGDRKLPVNKGK